MTAAPQGWLESGYYSFSSSSSSSSPFLSPCYSRSCYHHLYPPPTLLGGYFSVVGLDPRPRIIGSLVLLLLLFLLLSFSILLFEKLGFFLERFKFYPWC